MRTFLVFCSLFLGTVCFASRLPAADIAWISFHTDPNMASAAAMAATPPHTVAPDKAYTDLLTAAGHNVTRFLTTNEFDTSQLSGFDLVIQSRSVNSGHYESDAETAAWHGLTTPMMILGGYPIRSNRLRFTSGTTIPDTTGPISLTVNNPSHPIFAGIPLDATNTMVNSYADRVTFDGSLQRGISVNTNPVVGGGNVLATVGTAADPTFGGMIIGQWEPGSVMGTGDTLAGHRLVFLTGSREAGGTSEIAGLMDLTANGQTMFVNAANFMAAIPEPSTVVLFGVGIAGLGLLGWKKRRTAA